MAGEEAFVIETQFAEEHTSIAGIFLFVPIGDSLQTILSSVEWLVDGN